MRVLLADSLFLLPLLGLLMVRGCAPRKRAARHTVDCSSLLALAGFAAMALFAVFGCCGSTWAVRWFQPRPPAQVVIGGPPEPQPGVLQPAIGLGKQAGEGKQGGNGEQVRPVKVALKPIPGDLFDYLQRGVADNNLIDVAVLGFDPKKQVFREAPGEGALLIGFNISLKKFVSHDVVAAVQPVYLARNGEKTGQWIGKATANTVAVKAKAEYVVCALNVRTGMYIDGLSLKFARLGKGLLLLDDTYEGPWVGGTGGSLRMLGGQGAMVVGVCGNLNDQGAPRSLGLVTVQAALE